MLRLCTLALVLGLGFSLSACGDDGGTTQADAPVGGSVVQEVTCPATSDAMVVTTDGSFTYSPMNTNITAGQTVQFMMSSIHNVVPNSAGGTTDSALAVNFGQTKCLKFTTAGTYHFKCAPHGFVGTITVQ